MDPVVPGWKTSEFWIAVFKQILSILVVLGIVRTTDTGELSNAIVVGVTAAFAFIANAWVIIAYIKSRQAIKTQAVTMAVGDLSVTKPASTISPVEALK